MRQACRRARPAGCAAGRAEGAAQDAQDEAEKKEAALLAEFESERSSWTDREAMLTSGFHEIEDIVDGTFLSLLRASNYVLGRLLSSRAGSSGDFLC